MAAPNFDAASRVNQLGTNMQCAVQPPLERRSAESKTLRPVLLSKRRSFRALPFLICFAFIAGLFGASTAHAQRSTLFVVTNHVWSFNSNQVDLGTAWKEIVYDDSAWPTGIALFGQETTPAEYLPNTFHTYIANTGAGGPITVYFRTHFQRHHPPTGVLLTAT